MGYVRCTIHFSAYDAAHGCIVAMDYLNYLCKGLDLAEQALAAARWKIDSHNRCFGHRLELSSVLCVTWQDDHGFFHDSKATASPNFGLSWGPNP